MYVQVIAGWHGSVGSLQAGGLAGVRRKALGNSIRARTCRRVKPVDPARDPRFTTATPLYAFVCPFSLVS